MALRFGSKNIADDIDGAMTALRDSLEHMPFAKHRFTGQHKKVTTAMGQLSVAIEDVRPFVD